jgi:uncharacterized repeat protein (TIGR01451 family)
MKTLRLLALLIAAAMFLVACGLNGSTGNGNGDNGGDDDQVATIGSLTVVVQPNAAVPTIVVTEVGDPTAIAPDAGNLWNLEQGNYSVTVTAPGYLTWGPSLYAVYAENQTVAQVDLTPITDPTGVVAKVEIVALFDEEGEPYDQEEEINDSKDVFLFAAQTEERVGVLVRVTGLQGEPIANAPVYVNLTEDYGNLIAIYPGLPTDIIPAGAPISAGKTDADGYASFTIEATNAESFMSVIGPVFGKDCDLVGPAQVPNNGCYPPDSPAKFIVSAVGQGNINQRTEFKGFFVNMSHLHYADGFESLHDSIESTFTAKLADTRLGHDFGLQTNVWKNEAQADNTHYFGTVVVRKQPTSAPFFAGGYPAKGMMVYTLSGPDADLVEWVGCDDHGESELVCVDYGEWNSGVVGLEPKSGVGLADLPITVEVHASFVYRVYYGPYDYDFELKDYTFTKTWVGGDLEIDKYVTQHVLTWAGPDHTLKAFNFTNADEYEGGLDNYLSTVVITVSNDGGADYYNVTVRDQLPQELGVIRDTISDGGTYDEVNHVVTWDFNGTPSLQEIPIGTSLTFTFEVYARQKPGFEWDDETAGEEPTSPDVPRIVVDGEYPDYYCVTNGEHFNSVTVAGFYVDDDLLASQPVFRYTPTVDESTICVVRPIFELTKELLTQEVMIQGASAQYRLSISQVDRSTGSGIYAPLAELYPWEFGVNSLGTGHRGAGYELRNNTYARDIFIEDWWEVGLDFSNATNFGGLGGGGLVNTSETGIKRLSWSALVDLPMGAARTATITLTGNLVSDSGVVNGNGTASPNGANKQLDGDGLYAWANCVYAYAGQLNQLSATDSIQASILPASATDLVTQGRWSHDDVDEVLEACALVAVTPPAGVPFVRLSSNGEAKTDSATAIQDEDVNNGDTFYYRFTVQNTGTASATGVVIRSEVDDSTIVSFSGTPLLYTSTNGITWTPVPGPVTTTANATEVVYASRTVAPGGWLRAVIPATAQSVGETYVETYVDYTGAASEIGPVTEVTEVDN